MATTLHYKETREMNFRALLNQGGASKEILSLRLERANAADVLTGTGLWLLDGGTHEDTLLSISPFYFTGRVEHRVQTEYLDVRVKLSHLGFGVDQRAIDLSLILKLLATGETQEFKFVPKADAVREMHFTTFNSPI